MPSSSTRDTHQERRLRSRLRLIYARLYYSNKIDELNYLGHEFCKLLDTGSKALKQFLDEDPKLWKQLGELCQKKKRSENVWAAGDELADAAATLFEFGRKEEGNEFCRLAEQLHIIADELCAGEQYYS